MIRSSRERQSVADDEPAPGAERDAEEHDALARSRLRRGKAPT
jgi:hypothetical protein